jgi:hypothetical protein
MASNNNPWRHGDLNDTILKFAELGANPIAKAIETVREILLSLDRIENETARRDAARVASKNFQKATSNEQQSQR